MSSERFRQGLIPPDQFLRQMGVRAGCRVLALNLPRPYLNALRGAVGRRGDVFTRPARDCDLSIVWEDDDHSLDVLLVPATRSLGPEGRLWVLARKPGRKPLPGTIPTQEVRDRLRPLGMKDELVLSLGPDRYALRFAADEPAGSPGTLP